MSVLCAIKDNDGGVWIGSDTMSISNGYIKENCGPKWVQCGKWWIGVAGKIRLQNLIQVGAASVAERNSIAEIVDIIETFLINDKWKPREENGEPRTFTLEIIVTDGASIFAISGDLSFIECSDYCAAGSGAETALGSYLAMRTANRTNRAIPHFSAVEMIVGAITSACAVQRHCGGEPWMSHVKLGAE